MTKGVVLELPELIALQRYARLSNTTKRSGLHIGSHHAPIRGRGMAFSETRHYQAGDDIRHMEWRVTARTGRPHVKVYHVERERPVILLVDFNPSLYFGTRGAFKSVVAARLAALLAWTVAKQGDRIGGLLFSSTEETIFSPRSRQAGVLPLLVGLCRKTKQHASQAGSGRALSQALLSLRRVLKSGSSLVLISDFYEWDTASLQHCQHLRQHHDILAYHLCDALELASPTPGRYPITDGHNSCVLDTTEAAIASDYQAYWASRHDALRAQLASAMIQYVCVTADTDLPRCVMQTFPGVRHG